MNMYVHLHNLHMTVQCTRTCTCELRLEKLRMSVSGDQRLPASHLWLESERVAMVLLQVLGQWRRQVRARRRRVSALAVQDLAERAEQEDTGIPATNSGGGVHVIDVGATFDDAFDALLMASVGFVRSTRGRRLRSLRAGL